MFISILTETSFGVDKTLTRGVGFLARVNEKDSLTITIKKARSMLKKVQQMVETDDYCIDIMQQTLAVIGLLKAANEKMMKNHLSECFSRAIKSGNRRKQQEMTSEILKVLRLSQK